MIEMDFGGIQWPTMVLKGKGKYKYRELPIWIGRAEAEAIVPKKQSVNVPQYRAYDLLCRVIAGFGGKVNGVVINEVRDNPPELGADSIDLLGSLDSNNWLRVESSLDLLGSLGYKLRDNTVFARLLIAVGGKHIEVDCRPSDGIAVAIRANAPILVNESVLDESGIFTRGIPYPPPSL